MPSGHCKIEGADIVNSELSTKKERFPLIKYDFLNKRNAVVCQKEYDYGVKVISLRP